MPLVTELPEVAGGTRTQVFRLPPYNVIILNDDHHSFQFVIEVLQKSIGLGLEGAARLAVEAHDTGRAIVWTGSKEVAELKVEQVSTFHEMRGASDLGPLGVELEPAPG